MTGNQRFGSLLSGRVPAATAVVVAAMALSFALCAGQAFADSIPDLSGDAEAYPRDGVPVPVTVTLDQPTTREDAMRILQEYRQEAYDEGLITLPEGMTEEQYVYGFTWDQDLERIAVQRAIEACVAGDLAHDRPTGLRFASASSNGVSSDNEGLAGQGVPKDRSYSLEYIEFFRSHSGVAVGMNLWHSEIVAFRKAMLEGVNYQYGHYWTMVNPAYTRYGLACVAVVGAEWQECAIEGGTDPSGQNDESVGYSGVYDATVYANDNEDFDVSLHPYCESGALTVGSTSQISVTASSSFLGTDSWAVDPSYAEYETSDPHVVSVDEAGVVTGVAEGLAVITVTMGDEEAYVRVPVTEDRAAFRLYNPNSGEHFYTLEPQENASLVAAGWYPEGLGWVAPSEGGDPVYRLYNPYAGEHHYTLSATERDALAAIGWITEGAGWNSPTRGGQVLYREYNPNQFACNHNYTTDISEHEYLVSIGWRDEGTAWNCMPLSLVSF